MWINVVGAPSAKQKIVSSLEQAFNFEISGSLTLEQTTDLSQPELMRLYLEKDRLNAQIGLADNSASVNSFHFQHLVYARALYEMNLISNQDYDESQRIYNEFQSKIPPPSLIIYLRAAPVLIINKCKLEENSVNEALVELVIKYFNQLSEHIRVPLLELEATAPFDSLWEDVKFEIDQIGTTRLSDHTFWTKTLFKAGSDYFDWE